MQVGAAAIQIETSDPQLAENRGHSVNECEAVRVETNQDEVEYNIELAGGPLATLLRVPEGSPLADARSFQLRGHLQADGSGEASLVVDSTEMQFNQFGDAESAGGETLEESISFELKRSEGSRRREEDARILCELISSRDLDCRLYLVFSPDESQEHRLVITEQGIDPLRRGGKVLDLVPLYSVSMDADARRSTATTRADETFDVSSPPIATDRGFMDFRVAGELGGEAKFYLDPNHKSVSVMGDFNMSTLMGWRPRVVRLEEQDEEDPLGEGRRRYELVSDGPRIVRYYLVQSDGGMRLVIMRGDRMEYILELHDSAR